MHAGRRWWLAMFVAVAVPSAAAPAEAQQSGSIRGVVRSAGGTPVSGVQLVIEGTTTGALSNTDGNYVIPDVPAGTHVLRAEIIGFTTERREDVVVQAGQVTQVDFELRTEVLSLSELVVTGVTEATTRAKIPFTVARVGKEAIPVPPKSATAAIQGRVAGANVVQSSEPGGGASILLRSPTSINRDNSPLIVVDGAILTQGSVDISSLDIESVEVVKGAAAASLYGSRAASGVIQIRTTRGNSLPQDRTRFTFRSEYGTNDIPHPIEWAQQHAFRMNEQGEFLDAGGNVVPRTLAAETEFRIQDQDYPGATFDHIESLFDPGSYNTQSLSVGYNTGTTSWLATGSYQNTSGVVLDNEGYRRLDFRLNLDHRLRNDLSLSFSGFHLRSRTEEMYGNVFFDFIHQAPDVDLRQPDPDGTPYVFQPDDRGIRANPLYQIATQDRESKRARTLASVDLRYNPVAWLGFDVNGSYDRSDRSETVYIPKGVKTPDQPLGDPGLVSQDRDLTDGINASIGASLTREFGLLRTRTSVRALMEREDDDAVDADGTDFAVGGIPSLDALRSVTIGSSESSIRSSGVFFNTDLDFGDRYIVNALVRRDGSSLFGSEERWHTYYRASGAWRMAAEQWWPFPSINEFKLRYSRGTAGGRPDFDDQYEVFAVADGGLELATLGNRFLKPEKATEQEFGIDVVALGRFSVQLSYARQRTEDQLIAVPLPALYGFGTQWQNAGTIEGHTYEGTVEARVIDAPGLRWTMGLIADRSRNEIVEYDRPCHAQGTLGFRCAGETLGTMYGQRFLRSLDDLPERHSASSDAFQINDHGLLVPVGAGNTYRDGIAKNLWGTSVVIDGVTFPWGRPIRELDAIGNPAVVRIGDSNPDFKFGLSNQVQWNRFNLFVLVDGQMGGKVYNATKQRMYQYSRNGDADQGGKPDELKKPNYYYSGSLYNGNVVIDWFVEDGSYVKLREVALRYTLDPNLIGALARLSMERVSLSLVGRNLFTFTDYTGYDPEIGTVLTRLDNFDYPIYRTLTASVEIQF